jgi:elongation factor 1-beta
MAQVIVSMRIMPSGPDADLKAIEDKANSAIKKFGGEVGKVVIQPIAFGLKAINMIFVMDEKKGDTEPLEKQVSHIPDVNSVEVTDVRRAVG